MVRVTIHAFDKNSSASISDVIIADTKEEFNKAVEEFENRVPFSRFYTEIISDGELTQEDLKIVTDHEIH